MTDIDPREEARAAVRDLLDKLTWLALTIGVATTVFGLIRVTRVGWHVNVVIDQVFFLAIVVVLLLRNKLPLSLVVTLLVALGTMVAAAGFWAAGLGTMSFVTLTACCTIVGVVFGMRAGFAYLVGSIAGVALIGMLVSSGRIHDVLVTDPYLMSPQAWVSQLSGYAGFAAVILVVTGTLQTRLANTLVAVSGQANVLRQSESRYRLLADNMSEVLFLLDSNEQVRFVSPSVERVFGYTVEEFLELRTDDVFAPGEGTRASESFSKFIGHAAEGGFEAPVQEFEFRRKDGSTFWGEFTPTFPTDELGQVIGAQGLLRDISVRKELERKQEQLERELRQSEKLKAIGQLAGGIAHDFNNQLAPIMAHADLLARGLVEPDDIGSHARKILTPARNAADLTGKLLAFARKGSYEHRPVDVHEVINEVVEILAHGIDRRIGVKRHYEAASAVIEGDRTQLQNALLNLALNARDAMPDGGQIVFTTRMLDDQGEPATPPDSKLQILVQDTGEGMEESVLERIFEPFFTTKPPGKGTGMGLAAAYGTVARHRGRIDVSSRVGQGTVVTITLPLAAAPTGIRADSLAEKIAAGVGRVLVVDDEDGVRVALVDLLETLGCSVDAFGEANEAIEHFEKHWAEIDLVVLDLVLPDMTGREALAVLRKVNPGVKVLLVSGFTADDEIREILHSDSIEFLEKPFLLADLAESLTRLTSSR